MKYFRLFGVVLCAICCIFGMGACDNKKLDTTPDTEIGSSNNDENTDANEGEIMKIDINGVIFEAVLENNSTANAFHNMLPQTFNMNELNDNEKYCYLNTELPPNTYKPQTIYAGDIMLWGNNCLVIFYETFSTTYSYSKVGKIKDVTNLKQCLGNDDVVVDFKL